MKTQATVCCVMLVNGREAMVRRAVKAFQAQTYSAKRLLIWDTGELTQDLDSTGEGDGEVVHIPAAAYRMPVPTIGALRNEAIAFWTEYPIILHWDSDDWSHPNRIAEQVALLQSSGKQCVGYRDMLFWDTTPGQFCSAWLYTNPLQKYCLGTSFCYWREAWERRPFEAIGGAPKGRGEDLQWLRGIDSLGVSSLGAIAAKCEPVDVTSAGLLGTPPDQWRLFAPGPIEYFTEPGLPRMIAAIHGDNCSSHVQLEENRDHPQWKRVPEWDSHCREVMAL
jgi:hypothetical protein